MSSGMYTIGWDFGSLLLWGVHILSVFAFFGGIVLLIVWAVKTLMPAQLKTWGIGLVVLSTIACLFTIAVRGAPWTVFDTMYGSQMHIKMNMKMMDQMMDRMMEGNKKGEMMDHGSDDMMEMSMNDMAEMLEGKTGDDFDKAFIEGMIPHHQGAIDMAVLAKQHAKHDEIKNMADAIISAQQQEIDQMKGWLEAWGY